MRRAFGWNAVCTTGKIVAPAPDRGSEDRDGASGCRDVTGRADPSETSTLVARIVGRIVLVRVQEVDVPVRRKVEVRGDAEKPPIPVVVDGAAKVDERRRQEDAILEQAYKAVLLGNEEPSIGERRERRRKIQATHDDGVDETCWK